MAKKTSDLKYYEGVGRRKSAVARVRLYISAKEAEVTIGESKIKKGDIFVNRIPIEKYFVGKTAKKIYDEPFELTEARERFAVSVVVKGGGKSGQLGATVHGLARALERTSKEYRSVLKKEKLLTRDARVKERRKVGTGGKARRKKQSPKR